jgi:catechol 2,3-dioxygenase-like lactoylglutathione lyase family enzyme
MNRRIAHIALVVDDYDDAIKFYTEKLDFILVADTQLSETKRWVIVTPSNDSNCSLLLAKAVNEQQKSSIGNQTGGRVFLFLETDNFDRDYKKFREKNINFIREPSQEPY